MLIKIIVVLVVLWNLWVFLLMGVDKFKAKHSKRRIAERTLLLSALAFGAVGGIVGMHLFHHKTLHKRFRYGFPAMLVLHLLVVAGVVYLTFRYDFATLLHNIF